ncbi:MAG: hypothetical protein V3S33_03480 [Gammaproteobacteria bacterium]
MTGRDTGGPVDDRDYTYSTKFDSEDHPNQKITTESAERCLAFLRDSAEAHAAWTSRRKFLDKYIGIVLAMEETKSAAGTATDKARAAKKSIPYMRVLRDIEDAIYHETLLGGLRNAADKKFSGWQTLNANLRTGVIL